MTRSMGDAMRVNVPQLVAAGTDMVAGYVTGTSEIKWSPANWSAFPGKTLVTIDQGGVGSPVPSAIVRDFEQGAWTANQANEEIGTGLWTPARPTIYSDQANLGPIVADGWRRDLWVAIIGWQPGDPWSAAVQHAIDVGCTVVAVQNQQNVGGTIDLSVVLDPAWPEGSMNGTGSIIVWGQIRAYLLNGGRTHPIAGNDELAMYTSAGVPVAGSPGGGVGQGVRLTAAEEAQFLADFPSGNPPVTVTVAAG